MQLKKNTPPLFEHRPLCRFAGLPDTGFTLVEMAIVLVFIGLIIGAVIKGEEMVEESRLMGTMTEATAYSAAVETFRTKYNALPGDMPDALTRLNNCTAANFCSNGDGNKYIGNVIPGPAGWDISQVGNAVPDVETALFWKHLALAGLITGVEVNADPATPNWKVTHPVARMKQSGWEVLWISSGGDITGPGGHWLRLQRWLRPSGSGTDAQGAYSVAVTDAMQIDMLLDDGNSASGRVQAQGAPGDCTYDSSGLTSPGQKNCFVFFRLEKK